jgi:hypothetical protein
VAFVVRAGEVDASGLRGFLAGVLPSFMVPAVVMFVDALPLTANGKVDRGRLPAVSGERGQAGVPFTSARSEVERRLVAVWSAVLGLDQVGVHDNFFDLGGDSIMAFQIAARAAADGVAVSPGAILTTATTVAELARTGVDSGGESGREIPDGTHVGLTPIQSWFVSLPLASPEHWNQAVSVELVDGRWLDVLPDALALVTRRHEAFRLRFDLREGVQWCHPGAPIVPLTRLDLTSSTPERVPTVLRAELARAHAAVDPARGPVARAVLVLTPTGSPYVVLLAHHLVVDIVSWRILRDDLVSALDALSGGREPSVVTSGAGYLSWATQVADLVGGGHLAKDLDYWCGVLVRARSSGKEYRGRTGQENEATSVVVTLSQSHSQALRLLATGLGQRSVQALLLAAVSEGFARWRDGVGVLVDVEGHGRPLGPDVSDASGSMGWFTTIYPVWLDVRFGEEPEEAAQAVQELIEAVPGDGMSYHALRYTAREERLADLPVAEVSVNFVGNVVAGPGAGNAFERGPLRAPRNERTHRFSVEAWIGDDELGLSVEFATGVDCPERVGVLADHIREALVELAGRSSAAVARPNRLRRLVPRDQVDTLLSRYPNAEDAYPLAPTQSGILAAELYDSDDQQRYLVQGLWRLTGASPDVVEVAWEGLLRSHPVLRTSIVWEDVDEPLQVVTSGVNHPTVLPAVKPADVDQWVAQRLAGRAPLALDRGPLTRLAIARCGDDDLLVAWEFHHIILDGWSASLLWTELLQRLACGGELPEKRLAATDYRHFVEWARRPVPEDCLDSWRGHLAGFTEPTPVPGLQPGPGTGADVDLWRTLDRDVSRRVAEGARQVRVTMSTLVRAAWARTLAGGAVTDVVFGAVIAGRPTELTGIERAVGLFINTVPVRVSVPSGPPTPQWLRENHRAQAWIEQGHRLSLRVIRSVSEVPRPAPLFHTLVTYQNYPEAGFPAGLTATPLATSNRTEYPVALVAWLAADGRLHSRLTYDRSRLDAAAAQALVDRFCAELAGLAENLLTEAGGLT